MGTIKRKRDKWGRLPSLSFNDIKQPCWHQGCVLLNEGANPLMRADIPIEHLESKAGSEFYAALITDMMFSRFEHGMTKTHLSPFHFVMAMQSPETLYVYYYKDEYFETMQYLFASYWAENPEWGKYFLAREKENFPQQLLINDKTAWGCDNLMPLFQPPRSVKTFSPYALRRKSHAGIMLQPIEYTFYNHAFEFARQQRWTPEYHNWNGVNEFDSELGHNCYMFYENLDEFLHVFNCVGISAQKMKKVIDKKRNTK